MSHSMETAGPLGTKEKLFGNISIVHRVESFLLLKKTVHLFGFEIMICFCLYLACFCMSEL